jgi:ABC-type branched-subunit amino acid transport system ATPase component
MSGAGASLPRRSTGGGHVFDRGQAMENGAIEFRGTGLSKSFGGVPVLSDIDLEIARNQIIGIVGENGAGKTTLFNIMSGIVAPDAGTMTFRGNPYSPQRYSDATALGISRVFQEQALIPNILVYENLLLSHERSFARWGQWVEKKRMIDTAQQVIDQAGLDIDVRRRTSTYSFSKRQLIEIARACIVPTEILGIEHPVVLLDEPTSALEKSDEENFRKLITRLRERASIIFVSHRLTEVLELSDVIYVLKDGRLVAEVDPAEADERTLHGLMVGREREADYYHEGSQRDVGEAPVSFKVRNLTRGGEYDDVSLDVRRGEVIGLGGLLNSGKSEFGKGAAGIVPPDSGTEGSRRHRATGFGNRSVGRCRSCPPRYTGVDQARFGICALRAPVGRFDQRLYGGLERFARRWVGQVFQSVRPLAEATRDRRYRILYRFPLHKGEWRAGHLRHPLRRKPAKGGFGAVALPRSQGVDSRQSYTGRRRRRQGGDLRTDPPALGPARVDRPVKSRGHHATRQNRQNR